MFALVCLMLVFFPERAAMGASEGIRLCTQSVIVSLLPFAVFSSALIYSGAARPIAAFLSPLFTRAFGVTPYGSIAFAASLLGGYPTGVRAVCDLYEEKVITKSEGEQLLSFCNNSGAVFLITAVGVRMFSSVKIGLILFVVHVLAATATGLLLRGKGEVGKLDFKSEYRYYIQHKPKKLAVIGKSLASSATAILNVCAAVIVFNSIISVFMLTEIPILCGIAEMTKGAWEGAKIGSLPLCSFFVSFGGISVHAQTSAIASQYDFSLKKHFIGKCICAIISFLLAEAAQMLFL